MISNSLKKAVESLAVADIVLSNISGEIDDQSAIGIDPPKFRLETIKPHAAYIRVFDPDDGVAGGSRRIQFKVDAGARLVLQDKSTLDAPDGESAQKILAKVETSFLITYVEAVGANNEEEGLSQFAQHNVPFNVWPYWREVVHATFGRMGLTRVVLPLYRMPKVESGEQE